MYPDRVRETRTFFHVTIGGTEVAIPRGTGADRIDRPEAIRRAAATVGDRTRAARMAAFDRRHAA